jgi:CubicO group peptidase (beta-lactamase class C family)
MSKLKALILTAVGFSWGAFAGEPSVPPAPTPMTASSAPSANPPEQAAGAVALTKTDVDAWLDGFLPYALRTADIPGAVVTVVKDGQLLTARGFGFADREKRTPVDPERTLFRPGSVSKLITWTAVMQLVEQGKLDLDKDINTYLDFKIPDYDGKPITLRQIMTHTAGFEEAV